MVRAALIAALLLAEVLRASHSESKEYAEEDTLVDYAGISQGTRAQQSPFFRSKMAFRKVLHSPSIQAHKTLVDIMGVALNKVVRSPSYIASPSVLFGIKHQLSLVCELRKRCCFSATQSCMRYCDSVATLGCTPMTDVDSNADSNHAQGFLFPELNENEHNSDNSSTIDDCSRTKSTLSHGSEDCMSSSSLSTVLDIDDPRKCGLEFEIDECKCEVPLEVRECSDVKVKSSDVMEAVCEPFVGSNTAIASVGNVQIKSDKQMTSYDLIRALLNMDADSADRIMAQNSPPRCSGFEASPDHRRTLDGLAVRDAAMALDSVLLAKILREAGIAGIHVRTEDFLHALIAAMAAGDDGWPCVRVLLSALGGPLAALHMLVGRRENEFARAKKSGVALSSVWIQAGDALADLEVAIINEGAYWEHYTAHSLRQHN